MEAALERGDLEEALSHLDALITSTSPGDLHRTKLLASQTVKDLPALHHLAQLTFREEDVTRLDRLTKIFTDFGYDINKSSSRSRKAGFDGFGFTALLASIESKNVVLMDCLLRHGARTDIRDKCCLSPYHWAIQVGDLKCLEKLVQFEGPSVLATIFGDKRGKVHDQTLLHMAIHYRQTAIVSYLLRNREEFGVNVNEKGACNDNDYRTIGTVKRRRLEITPLERAIRMENVPAVQLLLELPSVQLPELRDHLQFCILEGYTEMALILLDYVSAEQLASDKIDDKWALHCLPPPAFQDVSQVEFTKKLILEYVRRGWDVNSVSASPISSNVSLMENSSVPVTLTSYSLLHLACIWTEGPEVIKALCEETGADINSKTVGDLELTPLQILLAMKQWDSAEYLIEKGADLGVSGSFKKTIPFTWVMRKNLITGDLERYTTPNAVELLVRMGYEEGLPVLNKVLLRSDLIWNGVYEFHLALEGGNPVYISTVLQHCAKSISKDELSYVTFSKAARWWMEDEEGIPEKVPTLLYLLNQFDLRFSIDMPALVVLIKQLGTLGCNLNLCNTDALPGQQMLDRILQIDALQESSNLLLQTILQVDHFQLNLSELQNDNWGPLETLWFIEYFYYTSHCWNNKPLPHPSVEAIKLLITHGLDVTGMVIDAQFTYHFGYNVIIKMLYCAGARISEEFFTSPKICHPGHPETQGFLQETAEVKKWKDEFDRKEASSLKHMCRLRVRKTLKCIGDLKRLDGLPACLKEYVLCKI